MCDGSEHMGDPGRGESGKVTGWQQGGGAGKRRITCVKARDAGAEPALRRLQCPPWQGGGSRGEKEDKCADRAEVWGAGDRDGGATLLQRCLEHRHGPKGEDSQQGVCARDCEG
jgi:hypothetical protein